MVDHPGVLQRTQGDECSIFHKEQSHGHCDHLNGSGCAAALAKSISNHVGDTNDDDTPSTRSPGPAKAHHETDHRTRADSVDQSSTDGYPQALRNDAVQLGQNTRAETTFPISHPWSQADDFMKLWLDVAKWEANKRTAAIQQQYHVPPPTDKSHEAKPEILSESRPTADHNGRCKSKKHKHKPCPIAGCTREFSGLWEVKRHIRTQHHLAVGDESMYKCSVPGCPRQNERWWRRDKARNHVREHAVVDVESFIEACPIVENHEDDGTSSLGDGAFSEAQWNSDELSRGLELGHATHSATPTTVGSVDGCTTSHVISDSSEVPAPVLFSPVPRRTGPSILTTSIEQPYGTQEDGKDPSHFGVVANLDDFATPQDLGRVSKAHGSFNTSFSQSALPISCDDASAPVEPELTDGNEGSGHGRTYCFSSNVDYQSNGYAGPSNHISSGSGKQRQGDFPPNPPDGRHDHSPFRADGPGRMFYCAFHRLRMPDIFERHRIMRFRYVSQLKRYHERHGLFYCGTCLTSFPNKAELERHERSNCTQYRCVQPRGCPNFGGFVDDACPDHGRTNSQEDIYGWICQLAMQVPQGVRSNFEGTQTPSEASFVDVYTPAGTGMASPAFSAPSSLLSNTGPESNRGMSNTLPSPGSAGQHILFEHPELSQHPNDAILVGQIRNLECLNWRLWQRLNAETVRIDRNLRVWYGESVPYSQQIVDPPQGESHLEYQVRVLLNLGRELWDVLHGISDTPLEDLEDLRERVHGRLAAFIARRNERIPTPNINASSPAYTTASIPILQDPTVMHTPQSGGALPAPQSTIPMTQSDASLGIGPSNDYALHPYGPTSIPTATPASTEQDLLQDHHNLSLNWPSNISPFPMEVPSRSQIDRTVLNNNGAARHGPVGPPTATALDMSEFRAFERHMQSVSSDNRAYRGLMEGNNVHPGELNQDTVPMNMDEFQSEIDSFFGPDPVPENDVPPCGDFDDYDHDMLD